MEIPIDKGRNTGKTKILGEITTEIVGKIPVLGEGIKVGIKQRGNRKEQKIVSWEKYRTEVYLRKEKIDHNYKLIIDRKIEKPNKLEMYSKGINEIEMAIMVRDLVQLVNVDKNSAKVELKIMDKTIKQLKRDWDKHLKKDFNEMANKFNVRLREEILKEGDLFITNKEEEERYRRDTDEYMSVEDEWYRDDDIDEPKR